MKVTGSLREKNGIYQMVVRVPDINGVLKQKSKSTKIKTRGANQRETRSNKLKADRMLAQWIDTLSLSESYGGDRDFLAAIEEWLAQKKKTIRPDSYESYLCNYNTHIKPYFEPKKLRLEDVTPRVIQRYVREKEESGQSRKSIRKHLVILNGVFKEGIALGELTFNPCANITVKGRDEERFEGTAYEIPTAKNLLSVVQGDPVEPAVYLGLFLGLRRSEVVGLRWKDVDMDSGVVHIRNTVVKFKTVSELEKTKSKASKRDLFMPNALKSYLQTVWQRQEAERNLCNRPFSGDEHICQWPDGTVFDPDYVSRRFAKLLEKNHLPKIRFHDLRHTAGSMLVNSGHTIKQVQEFLGHEKASTTLDIYSHVSLEGKKNTAAVLDELLSDQSA